MTKILWVDDNWHARATMELLQMEGYETVLVRNCLVGYQALKLDRFDVVIIDGSTNSTIKDEKNLAVVVKKEFPEILRVCVTGSQVREYLDQYMREFDVVVPRMYGIRGICDVLNYKK